MFWQHCILMTCMFVLEDFDDTVYAYFNIIFISK